MQPLAIAHQSIAKTLSAEFLKIQAIKRPDKRVLSEKA